MSSNNNNNSNSHNNGNHNRGRGNSGRGSSGENSHGDRGSGGKNNGRANDCDDSGNTHNDNNTKEKGETEEIKHCILDCSTKKAMENNKEHFCGKP